MTTAAICLLLIAASFLVAWIAVPDYVVRRPSTPDDLRDLIQTREHEILEPRPVELWAHVGCHRCYDLARGVPHRPPPRNPGIPERRWA